METIQNIRKQAENIEVDVVIFERNDDGLLLECNVETAFGIERKNIAVNFSEWNNLLASMMDPFLSNRVRRLVQNMVEEVDWIAELDLSKVIGRRVAVDVRGAGELQRKRA